MLIKSIIVFFTFMFSGAVMSGEPLNADELKALISNKTFDAHNVAKDKDLKVFDSTDGQHLVYIPWKDKTSKRQWWLEENKHCTSHPKRGDSCKVIINISEGVYHGITEGEHTHTLRNFRDGNQL